LHFPESQRLQKKNFLNSSPTSTEGALRLLSAPSGRFWQQTAICPAVRRINPMNSMCSVDVARRLMLRAKRGKRQFVVKTCR
jgi:hypothetical protein